jgi:hypothetical protein
MALEAKAKILTIRAQTIEQVMAWKQKKLILKKTITKAF